MTAMEWIAFGIGVGIMATFAVLFWRMSSH